MGEDPVVSQQNALHLGGVGHHDRHDVGVLDRLLDGFGGLAARFDQRLRCVPASVSTPMTVCPALTRWHAIGLPMIPSPMKAIVLIRSSFLLVVSHTPSRRARLGAAIRRCPAWSPCTPGRCIPCSPVRPAARGRSERDFTGARLTSPGRVGDLHVADPAAVIAYRGGDVVAVDVEVVEVGEQPQLVAAVFGVHTIDHADGVSGRDERIPWCAAYGFDQHRRADAVRRAGGVGQVLGADVVLGRGWVSVDAIAIERVEGAGPERFGDADGDVDVVAERLRQGGIGQNPAIACRHVTGGEVEARQLDTRVLDGADEGGDFGVRRRRGVERPPKLDRLEARVSGRARPVQQW